MFFARYLPLACASALVFALGPALQSDIDAIFAPFVTFDAPGCAVLVRNDGRTVYERGFGVRHLRTRDRIDGATNFRLASLSKQFTATAVMLLVHDGKLRYDTRLTEVFPDFPAYGRSITIRHLLTHTSGLPDYEDLMDKAAERWTAAHQIRDDEVLELLKRERAGLFPPGTSWSYSNSGYVVLGLVVAKVSGEPFARFMAHRVFAPLRMNDTVVRAPGEREPPDRAYGHTCDAKGCVETDQSSTSATLGDGGVYSNLQDLAKWDAALETHALLSAREMTPALAPATLANGGQPSWPLKPGDDNLAPGKPVAYGFGWFLDPWNGHRRMWHFGSTAGFRTAVHRFPADRVTVFVLCNRTDLDAGKLALAAADRALRAE